MISRVNIFTISETVLNNILITKYYKFSLVALYNYSYNYQSYTVIGRYYLVIVILVKDKFTYLFEFVAL